MVDIDAVLQGVKERDNWRRRLAVLERSLGDVLARRRRIEARLRRLRQEIARLPLAAEAIGTTARPTHRIEVDSVPRGPLLR